MAREQVAFQSQVVDEAQVDKVVAGTPLAEREHREAHGDLLRLKRHEEHMAALVAELNAERDKLLDRLLDDLDPQPSEPGPGGPS